MSKTGTIWITAAVLFGAQAVLAQTVGDQGDYSNSNLVVDATSVSHSGHYYIGDEGTDNQLIVTNSGSLYVSGIINVGNAIGADHNEVLVTGTGSSITNDSVFRVGTSGSHNTLRIEDGGRVNINSPIQVGSSDGSSYNTVIVDDGELQSSRIILGVGSSGTTADHNLMVITNGGVVDVNLDGYGAGYVMLGWSHGSGAGTTSSNRLVITGTDSRLTATNFFYVGGGSRGHYNSVLVEDGGLLQVLTSSDDNIRVGDLGSHNEMVIDGGRVESSRDLVLGVGSGSASNTLQVVGGEVEVTRHLRTRAGSYNRMLIQDGSHVSGVSYLMVGSQSGSHYNELEVSGASTVSASRVYLGAGGHHNVAEISGGSTVSADTYIYVGSSSGVSNTLTVTGNGTSLTSGTGLTVGDGADHNRMVLSGGATYSNLSAATYGLVDNLGKGGNSNVLEITGAGTYWSAGNRFYVGASDGLYNTLIISNGAVLEVKVNHYVHSGGYSNQTIVTDGGMLLMSSGGGFYLGSSSEEHSNIVRIENGGILSNSVASTMLLGDYGHHNKVVFDGEETRGYFNQVSLGSRAGQNAQHNVLQVQNGAQVFLNNLYVNQASNAPNNRVLLAGGNTLLEVENILRVGSSAYSPGASLTVSNGAHFLHSGGTADLGYLSDGTTITVTGAESLLEASNDAVFAYGVRDSAMTVSDGGRVEVHGGFTVGSQSSAHDNSLTVADDGSVLHANGFVFANSGSGNTLTLSEGGALQVTGNLSMAVNSVAHSNTLVITGEGSILTTEGARSDFMRHGSYNTVRIEQGGVYSNINLPVNQWIAIANDSGNHNRFIVDGGKAYAYSSHNIYIGANGYDNQIIVTNGGYLGANSLSMAYWSANGSNNALIVTGPESVADFTSNVRPGRDGSHNYIWVNDGASMTTRGILIAEDAANIHDPLYNGILVEGGGTVWDNLRDVEVGRGGSASYLTVSGGGLLTNSAGWGMYIGYEEGSLMNTARVTGAQSRWHSASPLYVGYSGSVNRLVIEDGGSLITPEATIGYAPGSADNEALVTGAGTVWLNTGLVSISAGGTANNRLLIEDGGHLHTEHLLVGTNATLTLSSGTLQYDASFLVQEYGALTGSGTIAQGTGNAAEIAGILSPGNSAGILEFEGELVLKDTSIVYIELGGKDVPGTDSDLVIAEKITIEGGTLVFSLLPGYTLQENDTITIFDSLFGIDGTGFALIDDSAVMTTSGGALAVSTTNLMSDGYVTIIPEPSTVTLLLLAAAGWILRRRLRA